MYSCAQLTLPRAETSVFSATMESALCVRERIKYKWADVNKTYATWVALTRRTVGPCFARLWSKKSSKCANFGNELHLLQTTMYEHGGLELIQTCRVPAVAFIIPSIFQISCGKCFKSSSELVLYDGLVNIGNNSLLLLLKCVVWVRNLNFNEHLILRFDFCADKIKL